MPLAKPSREKTGCDLCFIRSIKTHHSKAQIDLRYPKSHFFMRRSEFDP
jgi:hypothetical protein